MPAAPLSSWRSCPESIYRKILCQVRSAALQKERYQTVDSIVPIIYKKTAFCSFLWFVLLILRYHYIIAWQPRELFIVYQLNIQRYHIWNESILKSPPLSFETDTFPHKILQSFVIVITLLFVFHEDLDEKHLPKDLFANSQYCSPKRVILFLRYIW